MKIGCISVQKGAFLKDFKTMSNFKNFKNMEKMRVVKKKKCPQTMLILDVRTLNFLYLQTHNYVRASA